MLAHAAPIPVSPPHEHVSTEPALLVREASETLEALYQREEVDLDARAPVNTRAGALLASLGDTVRHFDTPGGASASSSSTLLPGTSASGTARVVDETVLVPSGSRLSGGSVGDSSGSDVSQGIRTKVVGKLGRQGATSRASGPPRKPRLQKRPATRVAKPRAAPMKRQHKIVNELQPIHDHLYAEMQRARKEEDAIFDLLEERRMIMEHMQKKGMDKKGGWQEPLWLEAEQKHIDANNLYDKAYVTSLAKKHDFEELQRVFPLGVLPNFDKPKEYIDFLQWQRSMAHEG